ncbi:protein FAM98B isoform X2 [Neoarius graeffei]|uniref:protein FAM98B isoform X2 n=1 Tax=Neoarius graeffei TaxID=443677 RepID=UPI00298BF2A3|nr:protein FAM98B isoform X2 [Neoarius graeffei]
MEREFGTISALKAVGYHSDRCMTRCECDELPCPLLSWLVLELRKTCPELGGDSGTILARELKEVLKVMLCPYDMLSTETLTPIHLKRITEFLVSELQAARMLKYKECNLESTEPLSESGKEQRPRESHPDMENETRLDDKEVMKELSELFQALDMDAASQLSDVHSQIESQLALLPEGKVQEPLLKTNLNSTQWRALNQINQALCKDYECRRQMMIKRFSVTLQSFAWGERGKERSALISTIPPFTSALESSVSAALLLAAREDQSCILPVTAGPSTAVHKVLMGSVPDRGGRPGEIEPPMPMFTQRSERGDGPRREKNKFKRREYSGKKKKNKNR